MLWKDSFIPFPYLDSCLPKSLCRRPARRKAGAFNYVSGCGSYRYQLSTSLSLLRKSGCLVSAKANIQDNELEAADKTAYLCGMKRVSRETFELPDGLGHREVIAYRKTARACVELPRKNGMAKHRPLFLGARQGDQGKSAVQVQIRCFHVKQKHVSFKQLLQQNSNAPLRMCELSDVKKAFPDKQGK